MNALSQAGKWKRSTVQPQLETKWYALLSCLHCRIAWKSFGNSFPAGREPCGDVEAKRLVTFSTLIWLGSRVCLPLQDTGSYTVIRLFTQKLVYAIWGLCWNDYSLPRINDPTLSWAHFFNLRWSKKRKEFVFQWSSWGLIDVGWS